MLEVRGFIDWIAATLPLSANGIAGAIESMTELLPYTRDAWTAAKPRNGYKQAATCPDGVQVMTGREDMGTHVIVSGSALTALKKRHHDPARIVRALLKRQAQFTRVDLALDAVDSRLSIPGLKAALDAGYADTSARRWSLIVSGIDGYCLYIGSRTSDRFERIYNKTAQVKSMGDIPSDPDWVRLEVELKGAFAAQAARLLADDPAVSTVARSFLLSHADFPHDPAWIRIMRGPVAGIGPSIRRVGNVRKWLLSACATALARELILDPSFQDEFERSVGAAIAILSKPDYPTY